MGELRDVFNVPLEPVMGQRSISSLPHPPGQGGLPGGFFPDFQQVFQPVLSCSVMSSTLNPAHPPTHPTVPDGDLTFFFVSLLFWQCWAI